MESYVKMTSGFVFVMCSQTLYVRTSGSLCITKKVTVQKQFEVVQTRNKLNQESRLSEKEEEMDFLMGKRGNKTFKNELL